MYESTATSTTTTALSNGDSHMLASIGLFGFGGPSEDNPGVGSPLGHTAARFYGVGTYLSGAWALVTPTANADLAYLVVSKNAIHQIGGTIKVSNSQGQIIADLAFAIAEPASAVLAIVTLVGLAAALQRRRG